MRQRSRFRLVLVALFAALLVALLVVIPSASHNKGGRAFSARGQGQRPRAASGGRRIPAKAARTSEKAGAGPFAAPSRGLSPGPNLAPGSNPSVLPSDVLIADRANSRLLVVNPAGKIVWQFPRPGDLAPGQTFLYPDDAFFTPNGKDIVATEEDDQVISLISIAQHKILWRYGTPGVPGSGPNQVSNPDDAMMLPNGDIVTADIKNCSILVLRPPLHVPIELIGENDPYCLHQPPLRFGSPNGAFPLTNGNYVITEINGDWADEMSLEGKVLWSTHPPGVAYPSDTNEVSPGVYLTADYSNPGQIVEFNSSGKLLWRYGPASGPGKLTTPSLCRPIPTNGDILCNDDGNDRVIVVDPRTNKIVWQYGHNGVAGTAPGYLNDPDGVDLAPPYALDGLAAPTMGLPTGRCDPLAPAGTCTFYSASGAASSTPTPTTALGVGKVAPSLSSAVGPVSKSRRATRAHGSSRARAVSGAWRTTSVPRKVELAAALSREVAVPDGPKRVLLLGGLDAAGSSLSNATLLDPTSGQARTVGRLAAALHDAAGVVLDKRAIVFGGGSSSSVASVESVSLASAFGSRARAGGGQVGARASPLGSLPQPRSDCSAVTIGSTAYVVGGYSGTAPDPAVLATRDGTRFEVVANLPVPVRYPAVVAFHGRIYVFGGEATSGPGSGEPVATVQVVDPAAHAARVAGQLPEALAGAAAAVVGGRIEVAGGDRSVGASGAGSGTVSSVWAYSPATGKFLTVGHLATAVSHAGVASLASGTWLVGGETNGTVVAAVQRMP